MRQITAPNKFLYEIIAVGGSELGATTPSARTIYLFDRHYQIEEFVIQIEKSIWAYDLAIHSLYFAFPEPIITKYMSWAILYPVDVSVITYVYYKLIKGTKHELIWEYATKHTRTH